jgi:hypothetical protein
MPCLIKGMLAVGDGSPKNKPALAVQGSTNAYLCRAPEALFSHAPEIEVTRAESVTICLYSVRYLQIIR